MQSSLWKLLTAAGIIGIGTLVVLEVQNRLPMHKSNAGIVLESTGKEISVTPDASTEFDDAMLASAAPGVADPASFDRPGVGVGKPAPPAADTEFFGASVERTVRKDELTDDSSPFSGMMEEPLEEGSAESAGDLSDIAEVTSTEPNIGDTEPIPFSPEETAPATAAPANSGTAVAAAADASAEDDTVIPFPSELPENKASSAKSPVPIVSNAAAPKHGEKSTMMFFPNGSTSGNGTSGNAAAAKTSAAAPANAKAEPAALASAPAAAPAPKTATLASATAAPGNPNPAQTVQRTSAVVDEPPRLFVPDPVPDLSTPALDETPEFEPAPFENDETPAPSGSGNRPTPRPVTPRPGLPPVGSPDSLEEVPFFSGDEPGEPRPEPTTRPTAPEEQGEDIPFMPDEPSLSTPSRPTEPEEEPFPTPIRRDRTPRETEPLDPGADEPFQPDGGNLAPVNPRPLPSADELPGRPGRPAQGGSIDAAETTSRTVSEVMRPQLTIQKKAPNTATVGVSHDYTIVVANEGASSAYDVIVEDELGRAAEFVESKPLAEYNRSADQLIWNFRELRAGERKEISVRIKPTGEGTLDGVATVRFKAQVKSATVITAPKLELQLSGPDEVKVGDEVELTYTIRNRGSGDAANVVLRSVLPPGLKHPEGGDLEYEIENLRAGESEDVNLSVIAAEPGELILVSAEVTSSGVSAAKARTEIEIVGAQLSLERLGPERRFVGRPATYQNIVTNESRFEAINAVVVEEVPPGMRFVTASNGGEYNPDNRRIQWAIPRLGAGKQLVLEVEMVAEESGQMETIVEVTENAGFRTPLTENTTVIVEDIHNLTADISRQDEPVAVGARFGFTVTIDNRGTAVARNVEMSVQVPTGLRVLAAGTREVPGELLSGNRVKYTTVREIAPNEKMTFRLILQGEKPLKNAPVQAYLKYDEMQEALIVSESVTVYDDRP